MINERNMLGIIPARGHLEGIQEMLLGLSIITP